MTKTRELIIQFELNDMTTKLTQGKHSALGYPDDGMSPLITYFLY